MWLAAKSIELRVVSKRVGNKETFVNIVYLVLIALALISFALAAVGVPIPRGNLIGFGLFCWLLATLVGTGK